MEPAYKGGMGRPENGTTGSSIEKENGVKQGLHLHAAKPNSNVSVALLIM